MNTSVQVSFYIVEKWNDLICDQNVDTQSFVLGLIQSLLSELHLITCILLYLVTYKVLV